MSQTTTIPTIPVSDNSVRPRLLSITQAVTYSGDCRATLYKEWKLGNLKFVKMGAATRIEFDELNRYIDAKKKDAA